MNKGDLSKENKKISYLKEKFPTFIKTFKNIQIFLKNKNEKLKWFSNRIEEKFPFFNKLEKIEIIIIFLILQIYILFFIRQIIIKFNTYEYEKWRFYYGLFIFLPKKLAIFIMVFSVLISIYYFIRKSKLITIIFLLYIIISLIFIMVVNYNHISFKDPEWVRYLR